MLEEQINIYKASMLDDSYKYMKNNMFQNKKNDIKIVATKHIEIGKVINTLCGKTALIKPEHIKVCFA